MAMSKKKARAAKPLLFEVKTKAGLSAVQTFMACEHLNQILIDELERVVWRAKPPGKVRSIAAIFAHMHNVRCKWIRLNAPHLRTPKLLGRGDCTPAQVRAGLAESGTLCAEMLAEAFEAGGAPMKKFRRDGWARPWPVGIEMVVYMVSHEAHHRGQVCMLAHQLGWPLAGKVTSRFWNWERLWKKLGMAGGPGARTS